MTMYLYQLRKLAIKLAHRQSFIVSLFCNVLLSLNHQNDDLGFSENVAMNAHAVAQI